MGGCFVGFVGAGADGFDLVGDLLQNELILAFSAYLEYRLLLIEECFWNGIVDFSFIQESAEARVEESHEPALIAQIKNLNINWVWENVPAAKSIQRQANATRKTISTSQQYAPSFNHSQYNSQ